MLSCNHNQDNKYMGDRMQQLKPVLIRMDLQEYNNLKKLAFLRCLSIAEVVRQSVRESIKKNKKLLIKGDIMLS
jgi:hypothetical protein